MLCVWRWNDAGQGQVLAYTLPRAQNRAAKGSTLLRLLGRRFTLPIYVNYLSMIYPILPYMVTVYFSKNVFSRTVSIVGSINYLLFDVCNIEDSWLCLPPSPMFVTLPRGWVDPPQGGWQ